MKLLAATIASVVLVGTSLMGRAQEAFTAEHFSVCRDGHVNNLTYNATAPDFDEDAVDPAETKGYCIVSIAPHLLTEGDSCSCSNLYSCNSRCGALYTPNTPCQCDSECKQFGNCCSDYDSRCWSCGGQCGTFYNQKASCQCNPECPQYGDCCSDYDHVCLSCSGRCGEDYFEHKPCQCDGQCSNYSNCCSDYGSACPGH